MTEQEYWNLLNDLGFNVTDQGNPRPNIPNGRALRHRGIAPPLWVIRRRRGERAAEAFWPNPILE